MSFRLLGTLVGLVLLVGGVSAETWTNLREALRTADETSVRPILEGFLEDESAPPLRVHAQAVLSGADWPNSPEARAFLAQVDFLARSEVAPVKDGARNQAQEIKRNPMYRDLGVEDESTWLSQAFSRLGRLFQWNPPERAPSMPAPPSGFDRVLIAVAWVLLGLVLVAFVFFAVRQFRWRKGLARKAKAVLEEDEPERTQDEWLELADRLSAEGRFREAVRCLYLACLLEFDERGVARFDRGETNWEHLARIHASPRKPAGLQFLEPTRAFDQVWYGFRGKGAEDVEQFRNWYRDIKQALSAVAA